MCKGCEQMIPQEEIQTASEPHSPQQGRRNASRAPPAPASPRRPPAPVWGGGGEGGRVRHRWWSLNGSRFSGKQSGNINENHPASTSPPPRVKFRRDGQHVPVFKQRLRARGAHGARVSVRGGRPSSPRRSKLQAAEHPLQPDVDPHPSSCRK